MKKTEVFNSPFELGVRMVFLLAALRPRRADLQRLMYLDYAVIYSGDVGGPASLHTPVPLRGAEYVSRREIIEGGLYLMASRSFVDVTPTSEGIVYGVGENGPALVELVRGEYARILMERCSWVASSLGDTPDQELEAMLGASGLLWRAHFVDGEEPGALV
jgi:hypothetical protein